LDIKARAGSTDIFRPDPEQPIHSAIRVAEKDSLPVDDAHPTAAEASPAASYKLMLMHVFRPIPSKAVRGTAKFPIFNKLYLSAFSPTKWTKNRSKA
jgi:hypothetical protein